MTITPWRALQQVNNETRISTIFSYVKLGELSMEKMCNEFENYRLVYVLKFIFLVYYVILLDMIVNVIYFYIV